MKPKQQSTFAYSFVPADAFAGRPIGLTVNLAYRDGEGNFFIDPVFNETVQVMMIVVMIVIIVRMLMLTKKFFNIIRKKEHKRAWCANFIPKYPNMNVPSGAL